MVVSGSYREQHEDVALESAPSLPLRATFTVSYHCMTEARVCSTVSNEEIAICMYDQLLLLRGVATTPSDFIGDPLIVVIMELSSDDMDPLCFFLVSDD